jgi:hypothetical protein
MARREIICDPVLLNVITPPHAPAKARHHHPITRSFYSVRTYPSNADASQTRQKSGK